MTGFLTKEERRELTGYRNQSPQIAWLKSKGLPFQIDEDRLIVMRSHVQQWIEGKPLVKSKGVNFSAVK
ncbi:hypothetical protein P245_15680 [Comamonas thiooxydans]|uniref:DUF4224 domain-containing protein n=2 Tax=Comamonas thiooxydans TaxID=363952 RepID=A0A0E3BFG5_9BURK|nr:hypothetical protein P245_15680 [Comamonas thiooxydans]